MKSAEELDAHKKKFVSMAGFSKLLREGCAGVEESFQGRLTRGGAANARKRERDTETQLKEHHARLTAESKTASARLMQPRGHATPTTAPIAQTPYWPKSATNMETAPSARPQLRRDASVRERDGVRACGYGNSAFAEHNHSLIKYIT